MFLFLSFYFFFFVLKKCDKKGEAASDSLPHRIHSWLVHAWNKTRTEGFPFSTRVLKEAMGRTGGGRRTRTSGDDGTQKLTLEVRGVAARTRLKGRGRGGEKRQNVINSLAQSFSYKKFRTWWVWQKGFLFEFLGFQWRWWWWGGGSGDHAAARC